MSELDDLEQMTAKASGEKWYLRWWMVGVWLFVLGPFGFPMLWKSHNIKPFWKWFWTIFISIATILVAYFAWKIAQMILGEINQAVNLF